MKRIINVSRNVLEKLIPKGDYCYDPDCVCPFFDIIVKDGERYGYCGFLQRGDFMENEGTIHLHNRVKECDVNCGSEYDEEDKGN